MKSRRQQFREWVRPRPRPIHVLARTMKPWHRYRIRSTGQSCTVVSLFENGTVKVETANFMGIPYCVFGVKPGDLERLPGRRTFTRERA